MYWRLEERVRTLAMQAGCDHKRTYDRFRVQIDQALTELLAGQNEHTAAVLETANRSSVTADSLHAEDDCTRGAIIVSLSESRPALGVIVNVQQQSWNALSCRWQKTAVVRFADEGERRINLYPRGGQLFPVLLRSSEVVTLCQIMQRRATECGENQRCIERKAS
jgi:hypothetical protein